MFDDVIKSLKLHEGFRAEYYKDSLGYDTVGYGFLVATLDPKDLDEKEILRVRMVTMETADRILRKKVIHLADILHKNLDWFDKMPERVQDVIVEMTYQMGFHSFMQFRCAINAMKNRRFKEAEKFMLQSLWHKQTPKRAEELARIVGEHGNQVA